MCANAEPGTGTTDPPSVVLTAAAGRCLRVALDARIRVTQPGQPLTGTLVEPLYVFDRVVVPAGAKVLGHLERLDAVSKSTRLQAMLSGDFTRLRRPTVRFDRLVAGHGVEWAIAARVIATAEDVGVPVAEDAGDSEAPGLRDRLSREAERALAPITRLRKLERLKAVTLAPFGDRSQLETATSTTGSS